MKKLDSLIGGFDANVYGKSPSRLHEHFCKHTRHKGFTTMPRRSLNSAKEEASPLLVQTIQAETLAVQRLNSSECAPASIGGQDLKRYRLGFQVCHLAWSRVMSAWKRIPGSEISRTPGIQFLEYSNFSMHPEALDLLRMWHGVYPGTNFEQRTITLNGPVWELCK
ncbi:hypothetical protein BOTU111921_18145 [Bordetella tumbae]